MARDHAAVARWAADLSVSWTTVAGAAYGWTWRSVTAPAPVAPPLAVKNLAPAYARLDEATVARMRRTYRAGHTTLGRLARQHQVSESTVRQAVLGMTCRHVTEPPARRAVTGGWTVLSADDEAQILRRRTLTPPEPLRKIARELGHDVATVHRAWRRLRPAPHTRADQA
ncbi:helix-turn-helix domain-containing protein [Kitasatospora sp. KL5]|uniref:helix-turn-helix domain-containing protein n=1 Tax=Kitasatospora sp. KL5 TaxID=3425125 RepID=UPI003D6F825A